MSLNALKNITFDTKLHNKIGSSRQLCDQTMPVLGVAATPVLLNIV